MVEARSPPGATDPTTRSSWTWATLAPHPGRRQRPIKGVVDNYICRPRRRRWTREEGKGAWSRAGSIVRAQLRRARRLIRTVGILRKRSAPLATRWSRNSGPISH